MSLFSLNEKLSSRQTVLHSLTAAILVGQVGKSPHIAQADSVTNGRQQEVELARPVTAFLLWNTWTWFLHVDKDDVGGDSGDKDDVGGVVGDKDDVGGVFGHPTLQDMRDRASK
ncbi:transporter [Elysia marginata]|uniref:Transporter n=1 Tax=Elysia marginata TaxID=1093978 RepID=A0AAV4GMZ2_9GAST|nr:transporter [Elysia marginata]